MLVLYWNGGLRHESPEIFDWESLGKTVQHRALFSTENLPIEVVIFDLGGVLLDWNPRYLYRRLFNDEAAMERFLSEICSPEWNEQQDAGRPWHEAVAELTTRHPDQAAMINAYRQRWPEMLGGDMPETVK